MLGKSTTSSRTHFVRLLGIILFIVLLWQADLGRIFTIFVTATWWLLLIAIGLNIPQITLKASRWRYIMRNLGIHYDLKNAILAYFGSIFIGLLTPGRLGEFIKIFHVSRDCEASPLYVFSTVLFDRLCDLCLLIGMGFLAVFSVVTAYSASLYVGFALLAVLIIIPILFIFNQCLFALLRNFGRKFGKLGQRLFGETGWITKLHYSLRRFTLKDLLVIFAYTVAAYSIFYVQCYLVARSLDINADFWNVSFAITIGSLVTMLPISISGLGTRDAAIIAYLSTVGVSRTESLSFSLLIFLTFYIVGAVLGALAWWIKPAPAYWKQIIQQLNNGTN